MRTSSSGRVALKHSRLQTPINRRSNWGCTRGIRFNFAVTLHLYAGSVRLHLLLRMVAAAHQRPGFDMPNPSRLSTHFPFHKLRRRDPSLDRQVLDRRLQVLAERENIATDRHEIVDDRFDLVRFFAESEHHARLCKEPGVFGNLKQLERTMIL